MTFWPPTCRKYIGFSTIFWIWVWIMDIFPTTKISNFLPKIINTGCIWVLESYRLWLIINSTQTSNSTVSDLETLGIDSSYVELSINGVSFKSEILHKFLGSFISDLGYMTQELRYTLYIVIENGTISKFRFFSFRALLIHNIYCHGKRHDIKISIF